MPDCKCGERSNAGQIHGRFVCRTPATLTESLNIDWINEQRRTAEVRDDNMRDQTAPSSGNNGPERNA